ncbi:MAG TPA: PIG-L family deacetylase [Trebonia sp.]|jgi:LmbE family N-acetylglucosaminyl deacetylase|nr:PIG-L family deacetylase [Trebonia sp.]
MTIQAATHPGTALVRNADSLPSAVRVLAVTARPFQESADLGGPLYAFRRSGASLSLLCLTRGEAGTRNSGNARLEAARPWEVQMASLILGIGHVTVASYRDGNLHHYHASDLAERIEREIGEYSADLLLVVAPETGDIGDAAVARAAAAAALRAGVPTVARTRPGVSGSWTLDLGRDTEIARAIQQAAAAAHATQRDALPGLASRLDQLGGAETLRWLVSPALVPAQHAQHAQHARR